MPTEALAAPEPQEEPESKTPPPARPTLKKASSKTKAIPMDLNALKEEINKPKEEEQSEEEEKVDLRDTPYTPEDMQKAWDEFIDKGNFQNLDQEMLKNPYQLEGHTITVSIPNEALVSSFERFRADLLQHIRNALKNDHITLQSKVVEVAQEKMRYTDREKFNYLKEKYPALKDLQDKLGLDPEF